MNITVYLGANEGNDPALSRAVAELGTWIGKNGHDLVYGGSKCGLMGVIAKSVLEAGGRVTGVEPKFFVDSELQYDEISVIHMFGVGVPYQRQGIAKRMVQHVIDTAAAERKKAIRLDVLTGNIPANRLYESMGFEFRDRITLFYEDTGKTEFELYEFLIQKWRRAKRLSESVKNRMTSVDAMLLIE